MRLTRLTSVVLALGLLGCQHATAPGDPPHRWEVRTDLDHHPLSYFYCINGQHEPRDSIETADAVAWYAGTRSVSTP